ncbi:saccharopine dehydrogenase-like oxidoreductase isoform X1 [Amyelois transitella]|uniref:saccharopine dehydrogenase-like oxidoreductase isoform X1 n=2 Tax=Amyelois transitella TaxID=680683 RepID=UPI002990617C|nr:saccharopine dehydrogenase-like oxidoreductase isoform X1 [Amyelois transitella]
MSRLDLVIFGATGFTGKKAVEHLAKGGKQYEGVTWGVAGRSQSKLESIMAEISKIADKDLSAVKIIVADISDEKSLKDMCSQGKVLVNCCGPYRLYGEPVVRAAIEAKTHYVDVSGEPQFIETVQLKYSAQARDAGVYIINACGFDSIPNDMGVIFLQQALAGGTLNSVESYMSTYVPPEYQAEARKSGLINYGTWESLVHSLSHYSELSSLRKQLYPERLPTFKPKLERRPVLHKRDNAWCVPFLGADGSIVYRTQRTLHEAHGDRPVQFKVYVQLSNLFYTTLMILAGIVIFLMSKTKFTRQLLLEHPRLFSGGFVTRQGPKEEVMNNSYFRFDMIGAGWEKGRDVEKTPPNKEIVARVSGVNPGYGATVVALLYSALTVLREQDKMPQHGVLTTGVAFRNTNLIKNLNETKELKFEILEGK